MTSPLIRTAIAEPLPARASLLNGFVHQVHPLPNRGSSFFIHPSEQCPVACEHCMYASTMDPKSAQSALSDMDMDQVVAFINDSRSQKLISPVEASRSCGSPPLSASSNRSTCLVSRSSPQATGPRGGGVPPS